MPTPSLIFELNDSTLTKYRGRKKHLDTFPLGIEGIGTWVFYGRKSLESIVLPQGLKTIGPFAFMDCTNLKRLVISPTNEEVLGILLCDCRIIEKVGPKVRRSRAKDKRDGKLVLNLDTWRYLRKKELTTR